MIGSHVRNLHKFQHRRLFVIEKKNNKLKAAFLTDYKFTQIVDI